MNELVSDLINDHIEIAKALSRIREVGVSTTQGQELLRLVKQGLLAHLEKEDKWLYPKLWEEAQNDSHLQHTLDVFASEMENISQAALNFFHKYENGGTGLEFSMDFAELLTVLKQRIYKEEHIIYKNTTNS